MFEISPKFVSDAEATGGRLRTLSVEVGQFGPLLGQLAPVLERDLVNNLENPKVTWPPLSADYAQAKRDAGLPTDAGVATRAMMRELRNAASVSRNTLTVRPRPAEATYFHSGTSRQPARPFLFISRRAEGLVDKAFASHVGSMVKKAGG